MATTRTNSKYHTGAHNKHRKASEQKKLAGWSNHKQAVYKAVNNKAKQCRRESRRALADDMNLTVEQLRHQYPNMDVHHTTRMSWTITPKGKVHLKCPINQTQLIDRKLNRGALRDEEIKDTKYSFEEQYNRAVSKTRPKKIAKRGHQKVVVAKTTKAATTHKRNVKDTTLKAAAACMAPHHTKTQQKGFLKRMRDTRERGPYTTLSKAQFRAFKSPCLHRNRPKCPIVITTRKNRRTHIIAGLHKKQFPCVRLHVL